MSISRIAAFLDEDSPVVDLVITAPEGVIRLDRRYLGRIWPQPFTLKPYILIDTNQNLTIETGCRAMVVLMGIWG